MTSDQREIQKLLEQYKNLQECILTRTSFRDHGLTLTLAFDYIWTPSNKIRPEPLKLLLVFRLVQEFRFNAALNSAVYRAPTRVNWGINEVARVAIEDHPDFLHKYKGLPVPFHYVAIIWEHNRRMDIVFSTFEINEKQARSDYLRT